MTIPCPEWPRVAATRWRAAQLSIWAIVLAACAGVPPSGPGSAPEPSAPFALDGRLSARRAGEAFTGNFTWHHVPPRDELVLTTPLGQTIAEITGDAELPRLEVRTSDGVRSEAADWATLTQRTFGIPLPVISLAAWIRGIPRAGAPYMIERDEAGRTSVLRQEGWEIVYGYAEGPGAVPNKLRLTYPDIDIRVIVDRWRVPSLGPLSVQE